MVSVALTTVSILLALWALLRFLPAGWDGYGPLPYLIAFIRFLWIPAAICLVLGVVAHSVPAAAVSTAVIVLVAVANSSWYRHMHGPTAGKRSSGAVAHTVNQQSGSDTQFTVMTLNCRFGRANAEAIVQAVRSRNVSVLALQELTDELVNKLKQAGLQQLLPYCQLGKTGSSDNGGFNGIWSMAKPGTTTAAAVDIQAAAVPGALVNGIAFYSAHPKSPMRGCRQWSQGVLKLRELDNNAHQCGTVIMGDLNSSLSHPSFRTLLRRTTFTDAGIAERHGHIASFPSWLRWPRLELDHILVSEGLTASGAKALPISGSDHLALTAQLYTTSKE